MSPTLVKLHDRRDRSDSVDWGCICGAGGSHSWMGYAYHLQGMIERGELIPAAPPLNEGPLRRPEVSDE